MHTPSILLELVGSWRKLPCADSFIRAAAGGKLVGMWLCMRSQSYCALAGGKLVDCVCAD
jgi:hypothetical protein